MRRDLPVHVDPDIDSALHRGSHCAIVLEYLFAPLRPGIAFREEGGDRDLHSVDTRESLDIWLDNNNRFGLASQNIDVGML